jgi:hypothetical protein
MLRLVGEIVAGLSLACVFYGAFEILLARKVWRQERAAFRAIHGHLYWD